MTVEYVGDGNIGIRMKKKKISFSLAYNGCPSVITQNYCIKNRKRKKTLTYHNTHNNFTPFCLIKKTSVLLLFHSMVIALFQIHTTEKIQIAAEIK